MRSTISGLDNRRDRPAALIRRQMRSSLMRRSSLAPHADVCWSAAVEQSFVAAHGSDGPKIRSLSVATLLEAISAATGSSLLTRVELRPRSRHRDGGWKSLDPMAAVGDGVDCDRVPLIRKRIHLGRLSTLGGASRDGRRVGRDNPCRQMHRRLRRGSGSEAEATLFLVRERIFTGLACRHLPALSGTLSISDNSL